MPLMLLGGDRAPDSFTLISFQSGQADLGLEKPAIVASVRCSFKDSLIVWSNIIIPLFFCSSKKGMKCVLPEQLGEQQLLGMECDHPPPHRRRLQKQLGGCQTSENLTFEQIRVGTWYVLVVVALIHHAEVSHLFLFSTVSVPQ